MVYSIAGIIMLIMTVCSVTGRARGVLYSVLLLIITRIHSEFEQRGSFNFVFIAIVQ